MSGATVNRHYAVLDAARGFAALAVLLYHIRDLFGGLYILQGSFLAVDLFFLMSGLVISKAYDRKIRTSQLSILKFVWLRIIRLYPLYIIASSIGATYFILKMIGHAPDAPSFAQMVMATLPAFFLAPSFGSSSWGFGAFPFALSAWSLSLEFWFNLVYALVVIRLGVKTLTGITLVAAAVMCQQAFAEGTLDLGWGEENLLGGVARFWFSFTLGVLINRLDLVLKTPRRMVLLMLPTTFLFVAIPHTSIAWQLAWVAIVFPLFVVLTADVVVTGLPLKAANHLGRLSYGVYILHASMILMTLGTAKRLIGENWERYDGTLGVFIVTFVIAVAAGLTYLVDEPLRALLTKPSSASMNVSALKGR